MSLSEKELEAIETRIAEVSASPWVSRFDAAFIVAAREDVPQLVAEVRRLRRALDRITAIRPVPATEARGNGRQRTRLAFVACREIAVAALATDAEEKKASP